MANKAIIYTRFSPRPNADESESCEKQEEVCREYCSRHGIEVAGNYEDREASGDDADRPGLWQAIEMLKRDYVLVVRWRSRLAREVYLSEVIDRAVTKARARIVAVEDGANGDNPQDRLIRQVLAAFAEYEKKIISIRTKYAMKRHQKNGRRMGRKGLIPFGWRLDDGNDKLMVPDENEKEIIEIMTRLRADGKSYRAIATELDLLGYSPRRAEKWGSKTIMKILEREKIF